MSSGKLILQKFPKIYTCTCVKDACVEFLYNRDEEGKGRILYFPRHHWLRVKTPETCMGYLVFMFLVSGSFPNMAGYYHCLNCPPELGGNTTYHSQSAWKNQAGTNLKDSFLLDSFHSTIRCYVYCQGMKANLSLTQL